MSLAALYRGVVIGNWLVFGGILVEETPALLTLTTFLKEKLVEKKSRTGLVVWFRKREKTFESIGLAVLLLGLLIESQYEGAARSSEEKARLASEKIIVGLKQRVNIAEGSIAAAETAAAAANTKAVTLLEENVELERALAPRDFEQLAIARAIADKPRVPILIAPLGEEEPLKVAKQLFFAIKEIRTVNAAPWDVAPTTALEWTPEGITVRYAESFSSSEESDGKKVAISLCEAIRAQGYAVTTRSVPLDMLQSSRASEWPLAAPNNSVVISVGQKPNHFWQNKQLMQQGMRPIPEMSYCTSDEAIQQSEAEFRAERERRQKGAPPK